MAMYELHAIVPPVSGDTSRTSNADNMVRGLVIDTACDAAGKSGVASGKQYIAAVGSVRIRDVRDTRAAYCRAWDGVRNDSHPQGKLRARVWEDVRRSAARCMD
eukprot:gene9815-6295_t